METIKKRNFFDFFRIVTQFYFLLTTALNPGIITEQPVNLDIATLKTRNHRIDAILYMLVYVEYFLISTRHVKTDGVRFSEHSVGKIQF